MKNNRFICLILMSFVLAGCNNQTDKAQKSPTPTDTSLENQIDVEPPVEIKPVKSDILIREENDYLSHKYAIHRKQQVKDIHYELSLVLDAQRTYYEGVTLINFNMAETNQSPLTIDFNNGSIKSINVNDKPVKWKYNQWFITLASELFNTGTNKITISYTRPYASDGYGLHHFKEPETGSVYVYSHFEPYHAHRLFPHFDQPNLRARYTLDVIAPSDWQVITSVLEAKVEDLGNSKHWYFPKSADFSSYILPLHAGPYNVWEDKAGEIPLRLFSRQSLAQYVKPEEFFEPTKQGFEFYQTYFGVKYPFIKYDQVISPDYNIGAMENVAAVTFNERFVTRGDKTREEKRSLATIIVHEMAHMWFGNLVTMDWWNGLWLKESFATYMSYLAIGEATEYKENWNAFFVRTKQRGYKSDQSVTTHAIELPVANTAEAYTNFDGITYNKGASVLRQLPFYLGEKAFQKGVSEYLKKYSYQATTLDDFMSELGKAANKDLTDWQQQWLYEAGVNTIKISFQCKKRQITNMTLLQSAPESHPTLRSQRIQVSMFKVVKKKIKLGKVIPLTYTGKETRIKQAIGYRCPDAVFPNYQDWGFVKVELDERTFATLRKQINNFSSVNLRLMLWQSLWEGVRDAKFSAIDYVDFTFKKIVLETDTSIINNVSSNLMIALGYIGKLNDDSKIKSQIFEQAESFFWQQTSSAEAGSDQQKYRFYDFIESAHTEKGLKELENLLTGKTELNGLSIDQDKRWLLIRKLNEHQFGDYEEILVLESEKDISDSGVKNAIASQVLRPGRENKEKWLDLMINQPEKYKLSTAKVIMSSLFKGYQSKMLAEFSDKIIMAIPDLNANAKQAYKNYFSEQFAPQMCNQTSVVKLLEANERFKSFDPGIVKAFKVAHQEDQICINILAKMKSENTDG